jgi:hypothetical protein
LKLLKFNQALKQSLGTMKKVFEVSINYGSYCSISFLDRNFFLQLSLKPLNYFMSSSSHCVLLSMLFPTTYSMWVFVAWKHKLNFQISNFMAGSKLRTAECYSKIGFEGSGANGQGKEKQNPLHLDFNWTIHFFSFSIVFLLFLRVLLFKLHQKFLEI